MQVPAQAEPSLSHAPRVPRGNPVTAEQVPTDPATLHASHCPEHPLSQQTPSTHRPETHWFTAAQRAPFVPFGLHWPASQKCPTHSASPLHVALHALAPQRKGVHADVEAAGQAPAPSHDAEAVAVPETHAAAVQIEVG